MAQALSMVRAELEHEGLDAAFLSKPLRDMECRVSCMYDGNGRQISDVVMGDPLHGPELHRRDYAEDANGP